jgi:hypothetical protein
VDVAATNVIVAGCALLTGDCGAGADTFSVEPSGAASPPTGGVPAGEAGDCGDWEQATAIASMAVAEQSANFFWSIKRNLDWFSGARWDERFRGVDDTTLREA